MLIIGVLLEVSKENEINHWYTVVNAILRFMLRNKNYSHALCCNLKYCVTMTPSPCSQGKKSNESLRKSDTSTMSTKSNNPITLHGRTLDFRIRRTPTYTYCFT
ncbi:unnamed protein product [Schistosoma margrebowiei]|uniref:Uncharacterized protein n=1 Tax=Schistosoma margrebowiei TaxID=48269 RepID=A0AA85AI10_9TREM|nr:unnamed protein product [Schistosoma margrebowiei]